MDDILDRVSDGVLIADADWRVTETNAVAAELLDRDRAGLVGTDVRETFPRSVDATFHEQFDGATPAPAEIAFVEYFPELETWLDVETVEIATGLAVYLRDVTERKALERTIEEGEAERDRLNRINAIIQQIIRDLVGATTRSDVEQTVCERLAATDLYEFTWIGEREMSSDGIANRVAAGDHEGILDLVVAGHPDIEASESPEYAAMRTGEPRIVREIAGDDRVPEPVRREAFARGLQSAIAVPLQYGTTTYGVLGVYATRPDAFSDRERESLETLGVATGFVINAARQRNLLLSDTVVELTFRLTDPTAVFVACSGALDCTLTVEGLVPMDEGRLLCYVGVDGTAPGRLLDDAMAHESVSGGRIVAEVAPDVGEGGLVECTLTGGSPLLSLADRGATVRTAEFDDGTGRIVAEVAPTEDVREIVEAVGEAFPETQLLAKRERQRSVETAQEFRSSLHERLTDRQQTALRIAFHGGYFESPRDSTAEELAETLGVTSPTLHSHLRAAQSKLVEAFLGEDSEKPIQPDSWNTDGEQGDV